MSGYEYLKSFGAVGDGVTDDGPALQSALNACKISKRPLYVDVGTYLINTTVYISNFVGITITGFGESSVLRRTISGSIINLTSCSRGSISFIRFEGDGASDTNLLLIDGNGTGVLSISNNQFVASGGRGLLILGSSSGQLSSVKILDNLFLSCAIKSGQAVPGIPQMEAVYCHDSEFSGNQFGVLDLNHKPVAGAVLTDCRAGNYTNNYHWSNVNGALFSSCSYVSFVGNRWETNDQSGLICSDMDYVNFVGNRIHTNSQLSSGVYDGMSMSNCRHWALSANTFFDWTVGASMRYDIKMDSNCNNNAIVGNIFGGYSVGSISIGGTGNIISSNVG